MSCSTNKTLTRYNCYIIIWQTLYELLSIHQFTVNITLSTKRGLVWYGDADTPRIDILQSGGLTYFQFVQNMNDQNIYFATI